MATILRRSGQLGRLSRTSFLRATQSNLRPSRPSCLGRVSISAPRVQTFASKPFGPGKKNDADHPQKSSDGQQPEGKGPEEQKTKIEPIPGYVPLTDDLLKAITDLTSRPTFSMPKGISEEFQSTIERMKQEGIPEDVADALRRYNAGQEPSLMDIAKVVRALVQAKNRQEGYVPPSNPWADFFRRDPKQKIEENAQKNGNRQSDRGEQKDQNGESGKQEFRLNLEPTNILGFLAGGWILFRFMLPSENSKDITWQELRSNFLDRGLVEKLTVVNGDRVRVDVNRQAVASVYPDSPAAGPYFRYYFSIGSVESFERQLEAAQDELHIPHSQRIPVSYSRETSLMSLAVSFGPTVLMIAGTWWLLKRVSGGGGSGGPGGVFGMGKSRAKMFNHERDIKVKFADVAGMDEAKVEIMEFVSFLKNPAQYEKLGAKIPRGAILSGPPGTGKTLLAKATAGESKVPFFSVSGSEFVEMFVGVGPSRVRDLFATARKNTPCIIFIDEIDAIGRSRSKSGQFGGGNDERESTLNQILTEMDGFNTSEQVVVLAGTNRPDILDSALMRPGRFDRHIAIDRPTMDGRKQIFAVYLKRIVTSEDIEYMQGRLAALTPGFAGADIANCVNEAALIAARSKASSVSLHHFEQAIERVIGGLEKKSLVLNPEEKKTVAYHEAGHAICGWYFKYADPLLKVSIIPRGQGALGYAQYLPSSDAYLLNTHQLKDRMAMTLGGRISEELHFDTVTSGASDDFNKVTRLATAMVTKWGMSEKVGPLHFEDNENRFQKPFAESTAQAIDAEVRRIVDEAYKQCKDLLIAKKKEVGLVAEELLKKEVLVHDDLVRLLGPRPFDDPNDFEKYFGGEANTGKSAPPPPPTESPDSPPEYPGAIPAFKRLEDVSKPTN